MFNEAVAEGHAPADAIAEVLTAACCFRRSFCTCWRRSLIHPHGLEISQSELAARMAIFLWSSVPDEELMNLVERGALREEEFLNQADRMLADERAGSPGHSIWAAVAGNRPGRENRS
jgi:hypothetical protein